MWRRIKVGFAVSAVGLAIGMTVSSSFAQDTTRDESGAGTTTMRDDNDGLELGWIGLAGLAGLAGLLPRDRRERRDHETKR